MPWPRPTKESVSSGRVLDGAAADDAEAAEGVGASTVGSAEEGAWNTWVCTDGSEEVVVAEVLPVELDGDKVTRPPAPPRVSVETGNPD